MASRREAILAAIKTRLDPTAGVSGRVFRSRAEAIVRAEMPALVILPESDPAEQSRTVDRTDRRVSVSILVLVHSAGIADQVADPILVDLHKRMMPTVSGRTDVTLGGLSGVVDVSQLGDDFEFAATDGVIITRYAIQYQHLVGDLETV